MAVCFGGGAAPLVTIKGTELIVLDRAPAGFFEGIIIITLEQVL